MGSSSSSDQTTYRYIFIYDYGDNSSLEEISYFNSSHRYERPGNYSYAVEGFAVYSKDSSKAYYGLHTGIITILGETVMCVYTYGWWSLTDGSSGKHVL